VGDLDDLEPTAPLMDNKTSSQCSIGKQESVFKPLPSQMNSQPERHVAPKSPLKGDDSSSVSHSYNEIVDYSQMNFKSNSKSQDANLMPPPNELPPLHDKSRFSGKTQFLPKSTTENNNPYNQKSQIHKQLSSPQNRLASHPTSLYFKSKPSASSANTLTDKGERMQALFSVNDQFNCSKTNFHSELQKRKFDETLNFGGTPNNSSSTKKNPIQLTPAKRTSANTKPMSYKVADLNLINVAQGELPSSFNKFQSFSCHQSRKGNQQDEAGHFIVDDGDLDNV